MFIIFKTVSAYGGYGYGGYRSSNDDNHQTIQLRCVLNKRTRAQICSFPEGTHITEDNPHFTPMSGNLIPREVAGIIINNRTDVTMEVLTSDLCDTFNNVVSINAMSINLNSIDRNAFNRCPNLKFVYFSNNTLTTLDQTLFKLNPKINGILLDNNRLTTFDPMVIYNLKNLVFLDISGNQIREFPIRQMPIVRSMEMLAISNNQITDIDEQELLNKFPKLSFLELCPNQLISRERLRELNNFFTQRSVKTNLNVCEQLYY